MLSAFTHPSVRARRTAAACLCLLAALLFAPATHAQKPSGENCMASKEIYKASKEIYKPSKEIFQASKENCKPFRFTQPADFAKFSDGASPSEPSTASSTGFYGDSKAKTPLCGARATYYDVFDHFLYGYFDNSSTTQCNYYVILSDGEAEIDASSGSIVPLESCLVLGLDFYAPANGGELPAGTYQPTTDEDPEAFTYRTDYTTCLICEDASVGFIGAAALENPITVTRGTDGTYRIETEVQDILFIYEGTLALQNANAGSTSTMPQIGANVEQTFTDCLCMYQGNIFESNTGSMLVELYTSDFDAATGAQTSPGYRLELCLFNKLFGNPSAADVVSGTYTMARNFKTFTYYPGLEISFYGMTGIMGTYITHLADDGTYTYSYATDGTITLKKNEDGTLSVAVDLISQDGYFIRGTFSGAYTVVDVSDDKTGSYVSTLTDDVELDLSEIPAARVSRMEDLNGCGRYFVEIGRFTDTPFTYEHDGYGIISFELLTDPDCTALPDGQYGEMEETYSTFYAPGLFVPGYFSRDATGGLEGSQYVVYYTRSGASGTIYSYLKDHAPLRYGTITLTRHAAGTATFDVNVQDDAFYNITGRWTGVLEGDTWDYTGIRTAEVGTTSAPVLYDLSGRKVGRAGHGVYIKDGKKVVR